MEENIGKEFKEHMLAISFFQNDTKITEINK